MNTAKTTAPRWSGETPTSRQIWVRATRVGFSTVYTGVNGQHYEAVRMLLSRGWKARRAAIRMIDKGAPPPAFLPHSVIHCARWAG